MKNLILRYCFLGFIIFSTVKGYSQDSLYLDFSKLSQLVESNSRALKLDAISEDISNSQTEILRNKRLPDASISITAGYLANVGVIGLNQMDDGFYPMPHFSNSYRLEANYTVYNGGKINREIDISELQQKISSLQTEKDMQGLKLLLSGYLLDLYTLRLQRKVYKKNIVQAESVLQKIKNQINAGMALKSDQIRNELLVEEMKLQLLRVKNGISILNNTLSETLHLPQHSQIVPTNIFFGEESPIALDVWQENALQDVPDLLIKAIESDISKKEKQQTKSNLLPRLSLYLENGLSRPYVYDIPAKDIYSNILNTGIRLSYPLDELYKNKEKVHQADERLDYAHEKEELTKEDVRKALFSAYTLYVEAQQSLASEEKKMELATENYRRITNSYYKQVALITDLTDASNQKLTAELQMVAARSRIVMRYHELKKTAGLLK
jgi:outer membrane protein|nr:TolC family protein [uncultured Flavobacterium sp.]